MIYPINTHIRIQYGVDLEDSEGAPIPRAPSIFLMNISCHSNLQDSKGTCSLRVSSQRGRCGTLGADQRPKSPLLGTTSTWRRQGSPQEILFKWKNHVKDSRKKSSPGKSESGHLFFPESLSRPKKQEGPRASNGDIFRKIQRHVSSAGVIGKYIFQSGSIIQPAMLVDPGVYVATWLLPSIFLESEALKIATPPSVAWHFVPRSRWHFPWPGEGVFCWEQQPRVGP